MIRIPVLVFLLLISVSIRSENFLNLHGFYETLLGYRLEESKYNTDESIMEARIQLDYLNNISFADLRIRTDLLYDDLWESSKVDLEKGEGFIDIREANFMFYPIDFMDVKVGRQIFTWGTGDQIFINDLFPKDWNSFFLGRDDEYLKAPSDAIKFSFFTDIINVDLIYIPRFDSDRYIDGSRVSYYNSNIASISGENAIIQTEKPDKIWDDSETSIRLYKNLNGIETAIYFYNGFWKSPQGFNQYTGNAIFPALNVYGGSIRSNILKGIGSFEIGYYESSDDKKGNNPFIKNSEYRTLISYEQEIALDFNIGLQYYTEIMNDYDEYKSSLPFNSEYNDEIRHLMTIRLTKLMMNQDLTLSFFAFYSPSDKDCFLRAKIKYKFSDSILIEVGCNIFEGDKNYTFFGQFDENDNSYIRMRYSF